MAPFPTGDYLADVSQSTAHLAKRRVVRILAELHLVGKQKTVALARETGNLNQMRACLKEWIGRIDQRWQVSLGTESGPGAACQTVNPQWKLDSGNSDWS